MVSCFVKKRSFFLGALLLTMFSATRQHCMSPQAIANGLKTVGYEVAKDLKEDMLSPYIDVFYTLKDIVLSHSTESNTKTSIALKILMLFKNCNSCLLKYLLTDKRMLHTITKFRWLMENQEWWMNIAYPQRLTEHPLAAEMAQQLHLNPANIHVDDRGARGYASLSYYTHSSIRFGSPYSKFHVGHELAHIAHKDTFRTQLFDIIAPWIIRATLVTANTLTRLATNTIKDTFKVTPEGKADEIITATHNILHTSLRSPWLESFFNNRLKIHYKRIHEKQADITAAKTFLCAEDAVKHFQERAQQDDISYGKFDKFLIECIDDHPTYTERVNYVLPIAKEQGYQEPIAKIINDTINKQAQYHLPLPEKLLMIGKIIMSFD